MAGENELVTVFRSADSDADEQAAAVRGILETASIEARVFDDSAPGVPEGAFEVRVALARQAEAERLIDAQRELLPPALDLSHGFDMVPVFASDAPNAELLATGMRSVLEAQGIPSVLVSGSMFPSLPFEIRVPQARLEEARTAIAAAEEAGPAAAEEGERETEGGPAETSL